MAWYKEFLKDFFASRGTTHILLIGFFVALGGGCLGGLAPETIADRYARLNHGHTGSPCHDWGQHQKPWACQAGTDDAQSAVSWSNAVMNVWSLMINPIIGCMSDTYGRRWPFVVATVFVFCIPLLAFTFMVGIPTSSPVWYYASNSFISLGAFVGVMQTCLSDVLPDHHRSAGFGLFWAAFNAGFALGGSVPVLWGTDKPLRVALTALSMNLLATMVALVSPETMPEQIETEHVTANPLSSSAIHHLQSDEQDSRIHGTECDEGDTGAPEPQDGARRKSRIRMMCHGLIHSFQEMAILNRNWTLRLITGGYFFGSMVFAANYTLIIYYIEEQLNVQQSDVARLFLVLGVVGISVQAFFLQPVVRWFGEKNVLVSSFVSGMIHNLLYFFAVNKLWIYAAFTFSQWTKLDQTVATAMASQAVTASEQGRVQGALAACNAVASALGPLLIEGIHQHTQNIPHLGPGFMWLCAAGLYAVGAVLVSFLPKQQQPPVETESSSDEEEAPPTMDPTPDGQDRCSQRTHLENDLEEPLLASPTQ